MGNEAEAVPTKPKKAAASVFTKSEFWITLATSVSGLLLAFGVITDEQAHDVAKYVPNIVGALMALLSSLKLVNVQHASKVEVFRAMCAVRLGKDGEFKSQGVGTPEQQVSQIARSVGL